MKNAERISRRHFSAARIANAQIAASTKLIVCFHLINRGKKENEKWKLFFYDHPRRHVRKILSRLFASSFFHF